MKETSMSKLVLELKISDAFNKITKYLDEIINYFYNFNTDIDSDDIKNGTEDISYEIENLKHLIDKLDEVYQNELYQFLKHYNKI